MSLHTCSGVHIFSLSHRDKAVQTITPQDGSFVHTEKMFSIVEPHQNEFCWIGKLFLSSKVFMLKGVVVTVTGDLQAVPIE